MSDYSSILVFNNEGQQLGYDRRYMANFICRANKVRYSSEIALQSIEAVLPNDVYDGIITYLLEALDCVLKKHSSGQHQFDNESALMRWMEQFDDTERNVSWAVVCKVRNTERYELYICMDGSAAPPELDRLEKLIQAAIKEVYAV